MDKRIHGADKIIRDYIFLLIYIIKKVWFDHKSNLALNSLPTAPLSASNRLVLRPDPKSFASFVAFSFKEVELVGLNSGHAAIGV